MSVSKNFPGLENLEKNQGLSRTRKSLVLNTIRDRNVSMEQSAAGN